MVQRVDYTVFPETPDQALLTTANKVLGHVHRSAPSFRELRDWLREQGLWNKELLPTTLSLFDLRMPKKAAASLGPWGQKFFAEDDLEAQKTLLFERLLDLNTLLVKYVLEALDMEGGGRLHSTYEMHRMLTSYVYPGEMIRLPDFQAWIKWMVSAGRIKLIGIRWGLTDEGKQIVSRLRMIDVEEFLEDEAEEAGEADDADEGNERNGGGAAVAPAPKPEPMAASLPAPAPSRTDEGSGRASAAAQLDPEEELLDMPPEAPPVDDSVFEKYAAQYEPEPEAPADTGSARITARPPAPRATVAPSVLVRESAIEVGCTEEPLDRSELIDRLREHGRSAGLGGGSLLIAYGLLTRMATREADRHLFLAALLARLSTARPDGVLCDLLLERVGGLSPVAVLFERPEALAEVVVRWGFARSDAASRAVRAHLLDAVIGGGILHRKGDTPTLLAEAPSSELLVGQLTQGLLRGASPLAAFWLIREMVRVELWKQPAARDIAFVPTRASRLMAYRLRLIDSHFAGSTARLIEIARTLIQVLPPNSVEAAAFERLAPADHLRFDCPKVPICQQPCAR